MEERDQILAALAAGTISPERAAELLGFIGLDDTEEITRLIAENTPQGGPTGLPEGQTEVPTQAAGAQEFGRQAPRPGVVSATPPAAQDIVSGLDPLRTLNPRTAFRGFATGQFGPNLSGALRQSALNQFAPTQLSFNLGAPETSFQATDRSEGFARFLQGGGRALSPTDLAASLVQTAGAARSGELGASKAEFFSDNERLFESVLAAALPRVNPQFRRAFETAARNQFSQQELAGGGESFLQTLGGQGGRLLGGRR